MIRYVIFDLDGTILNTLDDLTDAVNHAMTALKRRKLNVEDTRRFVGNGVPKLIERALEFTAAGESDPLKDYNKCLDIFTEYYNIHNADKTRLYDGIAELLAALKIRGVKAAVVTNKYDAAAQSLKDRLFPSVEFAVGARADLRPKPAPDGTLEAMARLKATAAETVYVGDGETDIATARAAKLPVVAVTWGFRDREVLEKLGPDHMIDKPEELLEIIEKSGKAGERK